MFVEDLRGDSVKIIQSKAEELGERILSWARILRMTQGFTVEIGTRVFHSGLATNNSELITNPLTFCGSSAPFRSCDMDPSTPKK